jgi:hypothetical protein
MKTVNRRAAFEPELSVGEALASPSALARFHIE